MRATARFGVSPSIEGARIYYIRCAAFSHRTTTRLRVENLVGARTAVIPSRNVTAFRHKYTLTRRGLATAILISPTSL